MAVKDPQNPARFLVGIECDGATYHSAKSARDRDRLRQEILERLGWRIRRVWSTDWFRNPKGEISSIVRELKGLMRPELEPIQNVEESQQTQNVKEEVSTEEVSEANDGLKPGDSEGKQVALKHDISTGLSSNDCETAVNESAVIELLLSKKTLREKFLAFRELIVRDRPKEVNTNRGLLRLGMILALLETMPRTGSEYLEKIPSYLRRATDPREAEQHLENVLRFINYELESQRGESVDAD
jgi:hypothetical protein